MKLTDPIFHDEEAARAHFEATRWPDGPYCPHCGETQKVYRLKGNSQRAGLLQCEACNGSFTVTVGTVMERSHVPLHKWALAFRLMTASKKGISAHQLMRTIGVTYKTAWFMCHRIREAMRDLMPELSSGPLGGANKVVEVDETYVGGKARNRKAHVPPKEPVLALVERGGRVRSRQCPERQRSHPGRRDGTADRPGHLHHDRRSSRVLGDRRWLRRPRHGQSLDRGIRPRRVLAHQYGRGLFQHFEARDYRHLPSRKCGPSASVLGRIRLPLQRTRGQGVDDTQRAAKAIEGAAGKRRTYRQTGRRSPAVAPF
jgi:transposase-like protein